MKARSFPMNSLNLPANSFSKPQRLPKAYVGASQQANPKRDVFQVNSARSGSGASSKGMRLAEAIYADVLSKRYPSVYRDIAPALTPVEALPEAFQADLPKSHKGTYIPAFHQVVVNDEAMRNAYYPREVIAHEMHHGLKQLERWHLEAKQPGAVLQGIQQALSNRISQGEGSPILFNGLAFDWRNMPKPTWDFNQEQTRALLGKGSQWLSNVVKQSGAMNTETGTLTPNGEGLFLAQVPSEIRILFPSPRPVIEYVNTLLQAQANNKLKPVLVQPPTVPNRLQEPFQRLATIAMEHPEESLVPTLWDGTHLHPDYATTLHRLLHQHQIAPSQFKQYEDYLRSFPQRFMSYENSVLPTSIPSVHQRLQLRPLGNEARHAILNQNIPDYVEAVEGNQLIQQARRLPAAKVAYFTSAEEREARNASDAYMVQHLTPLVKRNATQLVTPASANNAKALKAYKANQAYMAHVTEFTRQYRGILQMPRMVNHASTQRIQDALAPTLQSAKAIQAFAGTFDAMHQLYPKLTPERRQEMRVLEAFHPTPYPVRKPNA
jgi:hypothetical protein